MAPRPGRARPRGTTLVGEGRLRILWAATKPPWPPADGGRRVAAQTIEALAEAGHQVTVVAPSLGRPRVEPGAGVELVLVEARLRPMPLAALAAVAGRVPVSVARHTLPEVAAAVQALTDERPIDVVHAEQAQALAHCEPAQRRGLPVVLRAQNVESELWRGSARRGPRRLLARWLGARFARWEGAAIRRVAATVALTEEDARRLTELAGPGPDPRVRCVPAPAEGRLPAADQALPGSPALVVMGSSGWAPNRWGAVWFLTEVWPEILRAVPAARLHVFGLGFSSSARPGVEFHPAPVDSRDAFAPGSILVVPVHLTSGVRMKILEAWARGVPVVATPAAVAGLAARHGQELLVADRPADFVSAIGRLRDEQALGADLTRAGRALLESRHEPARVAAALAAIYAEASGTKKKS